MTSFATIRLMESSERYYLTPNKGNASGAYQYIASTWNNYRGYPHAYLAPPEIQDERALLDVQAILDSGTVTCRWCPSSGTSRAPPGSRS